MPEYFRKNFPCVFPHTASQKQQWIQKRLEEQFDAWRDKEEQTWKRIVSTTTTSFLGVDWRDFLSAYQTYCGGSTVSFEILSVLQLCPIPPQVLQYLRSSNKGSLRLLLYGLYREYGVRIYDFGEETSSYSIPFIDASAALSEDHFNRFGQLDLQSISQFIPNRTPSFRLVIFPQTRFSFIEDKVFHPLYPLPDELSTLMAQNLLNYFLCRPGFFNSLSPSFTEKFQFTLFNNNCRFFAANYPLISFESVEAYKTRKKSELVIRKIQQQSRDLLPLIAQGRYSRKFDLAGETIFRTEFSDFYNAEGLQSARALREYQCGDLDTTNLDLRQTSVLEGLELMNKDKKYLLVVNPVWIIVFPESDTMTIFMDGSQNNSFSDLSCHEIVNRMHDWAAVLINVIKVVDKSTGVYKDAFRTRLSKLQYQVNTTQEEVVDLKLIREFADYVAEITILLGPIQAQINILQRWQSYEKSQFPTKISHHAEFAEEIKRRQDHLEYMKDLKSQAQESQQILIQLTSTMTAHYQSTLAREMKDETQIQVGIAKRSERQNSAILILSGISVVFLPLSFITSYFGMNTSDIRVMVGTQRMFWAVAAPVLVSVALIISLIIFRRSKGFDNEEA